jgi:hypothetical protein
MSAENLPPITERELSYHEALAGAKARETAASSGGDPAALRAVVAAASATSHVSLLTSHAPQVSGFPLREDDLLVTLACLHYAKAFGADPRTQLARTHLAELTPELEAQRITALAALGFIFTQPDAAWDILDRAVDAETSDEDRSGWRRDFRRASMEFAGTFTPADVDTLAAHLVRLARRQRGLAEDDAGNAPRPAARS